MCIFFLSIFLSISFFFCRLFHVEIVPIHPEEKMDLPCQLLASHSTDKTSQLKFHIFNVVSCFNISSFAPIGAVEKFKIDSKLHLKKLENTKIEIEFFACYFLAILNKRTFRTTLPLNEL